MDLTAHGGDIYTLARELGRAPEEILDFSANANPRGTPPQVKEAIKRAARVLLPLPETRPAGPSARPSGKKKGFRRRLSSVGMAPPISSSGWFGLFGPV